jgi:hypothetical protein
MFCKVYSYVTHMATFRIPKCTGLGFLTLLLKPLKLPVTLGNYAYDVIK